jgi:hypothetical protein
MRSSAEDVGCRPGASAPLPWARGEGLPQLDKLNVTLPSYQIAPARQCSILVDRHLHKNGGSTVRDLFLENERHGHGLYLGYGQDHWSDDYRALWHVAERGIAAASSQHRLLVEVHYSHSVEFTDSVLPALAELPSVYASRGIECPLVLLTRVREPLAFYLSFYRWGVGFRQRDNPGAYGATFLDWAARVPNLQSTMMMRSKAAYHAEYAPKRYRGAYVAPDDLEDETARHGRQRARRKWENLKAFGATPRSAWHRLTAMLDQFAVVGTMERFDESLLLAYDAAGLPLLPYHRNTPRQKNGYKGKNADACPDMDACRRLVRRIAPRDHMMYDRYRQRLEERIHGLGEPFAMRVAAFKRAVANAQVCLPPVQPCFHH